jgi:hypothetical protein
MHAVLGKHAEDLQAARRTSDVSTETQIGDNATMPSVTGMPVLLRKSSCSCDGECPSCKDEENQETILRKPLPASAGVPSHSPDHVRSAINSSGRPLDLQTRNFFEPRLGYDLGGVRIHTDSSAGQSASRINARAYTIGNDIVLATASIQNQMHLFS